MAESLGERALSNDQIVTLSSILGRARLAQAMPTQFDGKRDLYRILGYPSEITFQAYLTKYLRQDIAGKVIDLPAQDTWRKPPVIQDGSEDTSMPKPRSPFLQGLKFLVERRRLWHYLQRVDRIGGIGRYGVLLIGLRGVDRLSEPLQPNSARSAADVIYLSVFSEQNARITSLMTDPGSERYGLPELYTVMMGEGLPTQTVHSSRMVHIAEDLLEDDIYGMPRLERVYNRLDDLIKLVGGGAELAWKNMDRGLHADVRDNHTLDDPDALADEIDEYIHGLRRFIRTEGVDLHPLGSDVVDPTGLFTAIVGLIAAASDIPQRILLGSERGELASSQDQANWAAVIAARQTQHAEPSILRPTIDRLIQAGALPQPSGGDYAVTWQSLFELNELERAQVANEYATAIQKIAPAGATELVVTPEEFRERLLGWPANGADETAVLDEEDDGIDGTPDGGGDGSDGSGAQ